MISGPLLPPEGVVERGLRPALVHTQEEVCRCLPRRRRHQPSEIWVQLYIRPNAGEVTLEYHMDTPSSRPMSQMVACLGKPTLSVQPMRYMSDMITSEGRVEEVLGYAIKVELGEEGVPKPRSRLRGRRSEVPQN